LHLAPKRIAFSGKTHSVLLQIARKRVLVAVGLNKNPFCLHVKVSPFCITTNLRRNRFFGQGGRLVSGKGTHNVKVSTENKTKTTISYTRAWATAWKARMLTADSAYKACCSLPTDSTTHKI